ncbi:acyl-CoA dehydrogenase [Pararhodonellum marinum]|uniref:acyl-CoA dehydrogenase n=1 Tax=Pararhodonellum marinum TaxID=2755358 RepID=UPI00188F64E6|nr:acyl-CoA dehydrogenase [Pararhodonellum marinum]
MSSFYSKKDLRFQLFQNNPVLTLSQYSYFKDHGKETYEMILDAADKIANASLLPYLSEMDRKEPVLENGKIRLHPAMKKILRQFGEGGWINAPYTYEEGGQQIPQVIQLAAGFIFQAANYSTSVFPFLTSGAANLIRTFGSKTLIDNFTPKMYSGEWQGTMALTEPDAGSSLTDLSTQATPTGEEGVYQIKGQKIYISCGDHDACTNVVHLLLARIKGAPAGTKGISLFVVPQKRLPDLRSNDVLTEGIYHKMGYKGAPIAHLMFGSHDNCLGYLVGEPHKGLSYMFQMMNEARIGVGMNATAIGTAAYQASLAYAKERPQGRKVGEKDPARPQELIIAHADVKRMLLFQKSIVEGSLSLILYCAYLSDLVHVQKGQEREASRTLLDLLTPIAKSYPSEMCCLTTSAAVQVLGGAGYTTDFPAEQYYREARIHPIHEGTTGIHGLDLLGRKVIIQDGMGFTLLMKAVGSTIREANVHESLKRYTEVLSHYQELSQKVTLKLVEKARENPEEFLADATLYLEFLSIFTLAWQWLRQGISLKEAKENGQIGEAFYLGKMTTLEYFYEYELVKMKALAEKLTSSHFPTIKMKAEWF